MFLGGFWRLLGYSWQACGGLQEFLKQVLSKDYYSNSKNYFNFDEINKLISLHKEKYYNPNLLWSLAMMQIFLRNFKL